jgi:hypothetical protein
MFVVPTASPSVLSVLLKQLHEPARLSVPAAWPGEVMVDL